MVNEPGIDYAGNGINREVDITSTAYDSEVVREAFRVNPPVIVTCTKVANVANVINVSIVDNAGDYVVKAVGDNVTNATDVDNVGDNRMNSDNVVSAPDVDYGVKAVGYNAKDDVGDCVVKEIDDIASNALVDILLVTIGRMEITWLVLHNPMWIM